MQILHMKFDELKCARNFLINTNWVTILQTKTKLDINLWDVLKFYNID